MILENLDNETNYALFPDPSLGNEECCYTIMTIDELEDIHFYSDNQDNSSIRKPSRKENLVRYWLIYWQFTYLGPKKLQNLHKVTTLKRPVLVLMDREMCRVYKLTKLRNQTSKVLSL